MQEKFIIFLHEKDLSQPGWAVVDENGKVRQIAHHDEIQGLASIAEDKEVIVIVPAQDVLLTRVTLPKMSRSKLAQALPFALEEQLVADIETLHFALGDNQPDGSLAVGVVARDKMEQWLTLLQSSGIKADCLIPMTLALPWKDNELHAAISDIALCRTGFCQGFACDTHNFAVMLDLALSQSSPLPERIVIQNASSHSLSLTQEMGVHVTEETMSEEALMTSLALQTANACPLNLLQTTYASKKSRFPQMKKMWKIAAYLAGVWVAFLFLYPLVSYFILAHRMSAIDGEIAQIYQRNFPQSTSMVAPKLRMEEKWQKLSAQIGENRLLLLLANVGKGMQATQSIKLNRMEFQNNHLTLELSAASSDDFSAFADFLSQQGLTVKQQNVNLVGERVNATLEIE